MAYSPEWVEAQNQVTEWLEDAGLEARSDAVGNVWGRLEGTEAGPRRRDRLAHRLAEAGRPLRRRARRDRGGSSPSGLCASSSASRGARSRRCRSARRRRAAFTRPTSGARARSSARSGRTSAERDPRPRRRHDRRGDGGGRPRPGADPRGRARRHRHLDRAAHRAGARSSRTRGCRSASSTRSPAITHYVVELVGRSDHAGARPMKGRLDPMAGLRGDRQRGRRRRAGDRAAGGDDDRTRRTSSRTSRRPSRTR